MIGVVLVAHGALAEQFHKVVDHVMGAQPSLVTVNIHAEDDMEQRRLAILEATQSVQQGDGVVIVTDMFGGTPSNLAISTVHSDQIEVIAGMNLPLLIKLLTARKTLPLSKAVEEAQESGRKYITVARNLLGNVDNKKA